VSTRRVVKDGILVGQNRGEVEDKRADKFAELDRQRRENGAGAISSRVDGFAQIEWRCLACGEHSFAPKEHAGGLTTKHCGLCGMDREHERVR